MSRIPGTAPEHTLVLEIEGDSRLTQVQYDIDKQKKKSIFDRLKVPFNICKKTREDQGMRGKNSVDTIYFGIIYLQQDISIC